MTLHPASGVVSEKSLPDPRSQRFSPMFSFRSLMVLGFTFKFMIYPEFIFVYGMRYGTKFIFLVYGYAVVPALFVEKIVLSPLNCLFCTFDEN